MSTQRGTNVEMTLIQRLYIFSFFFVFFLFFLNVVGLMGFNAKTDERIDLHMICVRAV